MPHSDSCLHHFAHDFDRALEIEAFAWTHVQLQGYGIQLLLAVYRQVRALGQVLADQAIDVLVAAALPGAVRVAKVDRHPRLLSDFGVPRHLPALVIGHALAHRQRHAIERRAEAFHRRGRRRIVHFHQHQIAAGALNPGAYRRGVGLALDQIAFPMARHQAVFDLRRAHMDADHIGNLAAPIHTPRARSARCLALAQTDDQFLAQLTDRQGIDRVIDRLATDVGITQAGYVHVAQLAGNLLGRQTLSQHMNHQVEALSSGQQLARRPTDLATSLHPLLGHAGRVLTTGITVAAQLTADGRGGSVDQAGNPAQAEALGVTNLNGGALFDAEFGIGHRGNTVPERSGVALSFCGRPHKGPTWVEGCLRSHFFRAAPPSKKGKDLFPIAPYQKNTKTYSRKTKKPMNLLNSGSASGSTLPGAI